MTLHEYGNPGAEILLIQPVGGRDRAETAREAETIRALTGADFRLVAVEVADWNRDLSPWAAAPVFGDAAFGAGAAETLEHTVRTLESERYASGGFSRIIIADCGMDEDAQRVAQLLCRERFVVTVCPQGDLARQFD